MEIRRSNKNRVVAGVLGGIAKARDWNVTALRWLWLIVTMFSFGAGVVGYLILYLLMKDPEESDDVERENNAGWWYLLLAIIILVPIILLGKFALMSCSYY